MLIKIYNKVKIYAHLPHRCAIRYYASLTALDAVLGAVEQFAPLDAVLVAGDFTYGPNQPATIARLRERRVIAVRGNGDVDLLDFAGGSSPAYLHTLKQFSLIRWALANTNPETLDFLRDLPQQRVVTLPGADPIRLVHGSPRDIYELLDVEKHPGMLDEVLEALSEPVLVFGHTHRALIKTDNGRLAINPGAVSMAIGIPAAAYFAILEWPASEDHWLAHLHHVAYNPEALIKEFAGSGLLDIGPLGHLLLATSLTGKNVGVDFMQYAFGLAIASGCGGLPDIPDDLWEQAAKTYVGL